MLVAYRFTVSFYSGANSYYVSRSNCADGFFVSRESNASSFHPPTPVARFHSQNCQASYSITGALNLPRIYLPAPKFHFLFLISLKHSFTSLVSNPALSNYSTAPENLLNFLSALLSLLYSVLESKLKGNQHLTTPVIPHIILELIFTLSFLGVNRLEPKHFPWTMRWLSEARHFVTNPLHQQLRTEMSWAVKLALTRTTHDS